MFKFFDSIFTLIGTVVTIVIETFKSFGVILNVITMAVAYVPRYIAALPSPVFTLVTFFVSFCVIVNIINKGS